MKERRDEECLRRKQENEEMWGRENWNCTMRRMRGELKNEKKMKEL